jgi:alpha-amylase
MSELVDMGVAGFRIDAAKHIRNDELGQILARLRDRHPQANLYIYQEVIDPGTEAIRKQDYYDSGNVLDFKYGRFVGLAFLGLEGQTLANLQTLGEGWGWLPQPKRWCSPTTTTNSGATAAAATTSPTKTATSTPWPTYLCWPFPTANPR